MIELFQHSSSDMTTIVLAQRVYAYIRACVRGEILYHPRKRHGEKSTRTNGSDAGYMKGDGKVYYVCCHYG